MSTIRCRKKELSKAFQVTRERMTKGDWPDWFQDMSPTWEDNTVDICGGDWNLYAKVGDWIILSDGGYFSSMDDYLFRLNYEVVGEEKKLTPLSDEYIKPRSRSHLNTILKMRFEEQKNKDYPSSP